MFKRKKKKNLGKKIGPNLRPPKIRNNGGGGLKFGPVP